MLIEKIIATNCRIFRAKLGITQSALAKRAGVSKQYIAKIEAGSGNITISVLEQLSKALGVTPAKLVSELKISEAA